MSFKKYLITMLVITIILWGIFATMMNMIDPDITNWVGFLLFYLSLFFAVAGTATIFGLLFRFKKFKRKMPIIYVKMAFRQSFLLSALVVISLFLAAHSLFTWFNLFLLIIILSITEFFLSNSKQRRIQSYGK
jgi:hypothetical protein